MLCRQSLAGTRSAVESNCNAGLMMTAKSMKFQSVTDIVRKHFETANGCEGARYSRKLHGRSQRARKTFCVVRAGQAGTL
jgi:hypothetical protein